jgi:hypothetical protein
VATLARLGELAQARLRCRWNLALDSVRSKEVRFRNLPQQFSLCDPASYVVRGSCIMEHDFISTILSPGVWALCGGIGVLVFLLA